MAQLKKIQLFKRSGLKNIMHAEYRNPEIHKIGGVKRPVPKLQQRLLLRNNDLESFLKQESPMHSPGHE